MKLSNIQITNSVPALCRFMAQPISVSASFKLKKLKRELDPIIGMINENIEELNERFALRDDKGEKISAVDRAGNTIPGAFAISQDGVDEKSRLDAIVNEVNVDPIKISDIPSSVLISEVDLETLEWLLVE